jgi:tetratricopeptide (TPR) repeat protein
MRFDRFGGLICDVRLPVSDGFISRSFLLKGGNMRYPNQHRSLWTLGMVAALALGSPAVFSETRTTTTFPALSQSHPQSPASASQAPVAEGQFSAGVPMPPSTPEEVGDALMLKQRYQAAIDEYRQVTHRSADVWNKMGIAYQLMFNSLDASRCYQASLRIDSKNPHVLNNLGTILDSEKEYGDAERLYHKALKIDPTSGLIYKNLGTNLLAQHKYKKGWEMYKTALEIDPNIFKNTSSPRVQNPSSIEERGAMNYYMAKGCVRAGMNDRAVEYLRMALNEGFTNPKKIEADSEFAGLRDVPAFQQLLAEQRQQ